MQCMLVAPSHSSRISYEYRRALISSAYVVPDGCCADMTMLHGPPLQIDGRWW